MKTGFSKALQATENNPNEREKYFRRLIEHVRTLYRPDDMGASQDDPLALLPLGKLEPLALSGDTYKLAFTPGLLAQVFQRAGQPLLPSPANVLGGESADRGGYLSSQVLKSQNLFPTSIAHPLWTGSDADDHWWVPAGRVFRSPDNSHGAVQELAHAREHFFLPHRYRDPFHTDAVSTESIITYDGHNLLMVDTRDPLGNVTTVKTQDDDGTVAIRNDYRILQPCWVTDPNRNRTQVAFDALGMVVATAVMGKPGENKGDNLVDFAADLTQTEIDTLHDALDPHAPAANLLKGASTRVVYDLHRFRLSRRAHPEDQARWEPPYAATLARETHAGDLMPQGLKIQLGFSYSDGFGREIQKKIQAETGPVPKRNADGRIILEPDGSPVMTANDVSPRWVGSGWTVFNNKGKPVRQYEPFFTDTHRFEFDVRVGVSPVLFYDPVERVVAALHPNHTYEKVVFDPWRQTTYDVNDTVAFDPRNDDDIGGYVSEYFKQVAPQPDDWATWLRQRGVNPLAPPPDMPGLEPEKKAAVHTLPHADTPTVAHFDTLGRDFLAITHNKFKRKQPDGTVETVEEKYPTRVELDIEGNQRAVRDAVVQNGDARGRIVMRYDYDMLGTRIRQASMEAGERWMLNDVAGKPIRAWDSRQFMRRITYDELRRSTGVFVTENGAEWLAERTVYGEAQGDAKNHRTRVHEVFDGAGVFTSIAYDFKGNLLESRRDLLPDYKQTVDWLQTPVADDGSFTSHTTYDALNRPVTLTTPDKSVYRPAFNEANLLDKVDVSLRGAAAATPLVTNIDYNAKGQRTLIHYANGAKTTYGYDDQTFRLIHLKTTRAPGQNGPASQIFVNAGTVQDLHYTHDPAGNITRIADDALPVIAHNNQQVASVCEYTYDALYRLIEASGREHIGQTAFAFDPADGNFRDYPFVGRGANPNDPQALRNYTEQYEYDAAGNFEKLVHQAANGSWTRTYACNEASLLEPTKHSNRLSGTTIGQRIEAYSYDTHGNMMKMPHLTLMRWDFKDQLSATARHAVNNGAPETTFYVHDAGGRRVRKVTERQNGTRRDERIYLGGFEIYREYNASSQAAKLERETLHVMDDKHRIALVETKTIENGVTINTPVPLQRYQLGNHLGSSGLELDKDGGLISYEEYHAHGTTSYQAMNGAADVSLKRYRFLGKERDGETGFYYCEARHFCAWLGRWINTDPKGLEGGHNLYSYAKNNPVTFSDAGGKDPDDDLPVGVSTKPGPGAVPLFGPVPQPLGSPVALQGQGPNQSAYVPRAIRPYSTLEATQSTTFTSPTDPATGWTGQSGLTLNTRFVLTPRLELGASGTYQRKFTLGGASVSGPADTYSLSGSFHTSEAQPGPSTRYYSGNGLFGTGSVFFNQGPGGSNTGSLNLTYVRTWSWKRGDDRLTLDLNAGTTIYGHTEIMGMPSAGVVSPQFGFNASFPGGWNVEAFTGFNLATAGARPDTNDRRNLPTPFSLRAGAGVGYQITGGDYGFGIEAGSNIEFGSTVTAVPDGQNWAVTPWINLGFGAVQRRVTFGDTASFPGRF